MYYKTCYWCGAHLDPGERCDCEKAPSAGTAGAIGKCCDSPIAISLPENPQLVNQIKI